MGDRYYLKLKCAYCGQENPDPKKIDPEIWESEYVYYAPTCGYETFKCDFCGKDNNIKDFHCAVKSELLD